jgi:uncharacterized protein YcbK (DUF882 family)
VGTLSKHFDKDQFQCKGLACCGHECFIHPLLLDGLETISDLLSEPLLITSAYRCEKHNNAVGGEIDSYHLNGMAVDLAWPKKIKKQNFIDLVESIPQFKNGGIGIYNNHIHVDVSGLKERWIG